MNNVGTFSQEFVIAKGVTSAPAAATQDAGKVEVYWRGAQNRLKRKAYPAWEGASQVWGWDEDLGGELHSAPSAASWAPGRVDVFIQSLDLGIDQTYWEAEYWRP